MYAALARAVLDVTNRDAAVAQVEKLKQRHPRASREELASRLIRSTALRCGAAGLAWSGPAAYFGSIPMGPDLAFQIVALNRLILSLAALYRSDAAGRDRAAGLAVSLGAGFAADSLRRGIVTLLSKSLPRRPGARALAGGLAGAALAYGTALALGNLAREVFGGGAGFFPRRRPW